MGFSVIIYGSCSAAFVALISLIVIRGRISGPGIAISIACALTAIWSADAALPSVRLGTLTPLLDSLRLSAWLVLLVGLVRPPAKGHGRHAPLTFLLAAAFSVVVVGYEIIPLITIPDPSLPSRRVSDFLRIGMGVGGLFAAENLLRNADEAQRRNVWPLCVALGGMFAFELFLYADRMLMGGLDPILADGRGLVALVAVPPLALAMARNRDWRVDIHVSRTIVLHSTALVASGVFFLSLAAVAIFVRELGGKWGPVYQLLTLAGSAVVLISAFGSRELRIYLKRFISRHFFSHRFDYRAEWSRFVDTVSRSDSVNQGLSLRVVRALAQIVDAPAGTLWALEDGRAYVPSAVWNLLNASGQKLPIDHEFIKGFRDGGWIQERRERTDSSWPFGIERAWLAVPLSYGDRMVAFVVLTAPAQFYSLDWETFDLLRAAGKQAASYLAEDRSTRELIDTRLLNEYSKRFAFVVHDIKNLANQLSLIIANARNHIDDIEFRKDMMLTIENSVSRMNRLLVQLRGEEHTASVPLIEPDRIMADLAHELVSTGVLVEARLEAKGVQVAMDQDQFRSMLFHLINNAHEASRSQSAVVVTSRCAQKKLIIDVVDNGPGMDDEFVREKLFRPFHSTKARGFGIGAYQIRDVIRTAGGELDVNSQKGVGTVMRLTIPVQSELQRASSLA